MMPVFGLSVLSAAALALIAVSALYVIQRPAYRSHDIPSINVGDPGENLVGPDWSGLPQRYRDTLH